MQLRVPPSGEFGNQASEAGSLGTRPGLRVRVLLGVALCLGVQVGVIWQYRYEFLQGLREGGIQEHPEALSFWPGRAKRAGMASGDHAGFSVSEALESPAMKRFVPGQEAESFRYSEAPIHGRYWASGLWGPEPEPPP